MWWCGPLCIQFDIEGREEVGGGREEVCEEMCEGKEEVVRRGRRW